MKIGLMKNDRVSDCGNLRLYEEAAYTTLRATL